MSNPSINHSTWHFVSNHHWPPSLDKKIAFCLTLFLRRVTASSIRVNSSCDLSLSLLLNSKNLRNRCSSSFTLFASPCSSSYWHLAGSRLFVPRPERTRRFVLIPKRTEAVETTQSSLRRRKPSSLSQSFFNSLNLSDFSQFIPPTPVSNPVFRTIGSQLFAAILGPIFTNSQEVRSATLEEDSSLQADSRLL